MYETYVPIRVERKPPTIAEIVRQKTDDGARIIDFFLDVMEGRVEDARLCHRIDAAKQLVKYGYKKAADFIAEHGDENLRSLREPEARPTPPQGRSRGSYPPLPRRERAGVRVTRPTSHLTSSLCSLRTSSPCSQRWTKT